MIDPYEAWEPWPVNIDTSQGVTTFMSETVPLDMPEARPFRGFGK